METRSFRLGELGYIVTGKTPPTKHSEYYNGDTPFLTPSDDMNGKYAPKTARTLSEAGVSVTRRCLLPAGAICMSCIGSDLGKVVITREPLVTNQQINSIVPQQELVDLDFLYYSMLPLGRRLNALSKTSTAVPIVNKSTFSDCEIELPELPIQRAIGYILATTDQKIEVNKRTNDYLAESIRALFSHWFVDFAPFTGEPYVESEIGRIPSSIRLVPLKDLTKTITKGTTPTTLGYRFTEHGINYIKGESILDDHSFDYSKFAHIDDETNIALKRSIIENRDLLFTIAGTLGRFAMAVPEILPANTNQAVGIIRPDVEKIAPEVLLSYFISGWQNDYYSRRVQQAVQANLSLTTLKSLPVPLLIGERRIEYEDLIVPIVHAIESNNAQNRKLTDLRDTLLPKLMSGEIDMSEIAVF